jgi:hypothetical protein
MGATGIEADPPPFLNFRAPLASGRTVKPKNAHRSSTIPAGPPVWRCRGGRRRDREAGLSACRSKHDEGQDGQDLQRGPQRASERVACLRSAPFRGAGTNRSSGAPGWDGTAAGRAQGAAESVPAAAKWPRSTQGHRHARSGPAGAAQTHSQHRGSGTHGVRRETIADRAGCNPNAGPGGRPEPDGPAWRPGTGGLHGADRGCPAAARLRTVLRAVRIAPVEPKRRTGTRNAPAAVCADTGASLTGHTCRSDAAEKLPNTRQN